MIDCTPEVMSFPIYLHKDFIKVPLPVAWLQAPGPSLFDLARKLRAKPVPPVPDRFIAYIHAAFMKQVFNVPQWEWKPYIQHHRKLDDLWTGFEIAERYRIGHVTEVNFQDAVGQGGLFWQSLLEKYSALWPSKTKPEKRSRSLTSLWSRYLYGWDIFSPTQEIIYLQIFA